MQINKETVNFITDSFDELATMYYNYYNNLNLENVSESKDNVIRVSYLEALNVNFRIVVSFRLPCFPSVFNP